MKNLIISSLIFLTIPLVNAQEKPTKEEVIQARSTLDGWCQTLKSLRTFQDKTKMKGGEEFLNAFFSSELEKMYPGFSLSVKLEKLDRTCNHQ